MRVRFRGVRGSVPWSTAESAEAGSNTPCVELSAGSQTLILDAGTGLVGVGEDVDMGCMAGGWAATARRSEEHTSELQSH